MPRSLSTSLRTWMCFTSPRISTVVATCVTGSTMSIIWNSLLHLRCQYSVRIQGEFHQTSHSILNALSFTRAAFTRSWRSVNRVETQTRSPSIYKRQTLGSFVNPLTAHSPIVDGALIEQALACSTKGSLMMLTVKPFPDLMLLVVSLTRSGPLEHEMETVGGLAVTMLNQLRGH